MLAMNPQTIGDERTLVRQIILLSLAAFASAVSARISDPLLPQLAATFLLSTGEAAHAVSAFALAYGLLQLCYGPLGDRYGKYRVITLACLACTLGGLGSALAFGFPSLVAFRFLTGATAAALIPLSMAWIADNVPYEQRQHILAYFLTGQILGVIGGQMLGGLFADLTGWRGAFACMTLIFLLVGGLLLAELRRAGAGTAHQAATHSFATNLRFIVGDAWSRTILLSVGAEGALVFGALAFVPAYLHQRFGISLTLAGAALAMFGLGGLSYTSFARHIVRRLGERRMALAGGLVLCLAFVLLAAGNHWQWVVPAGWCAGFGYYLLHNTLQINATQMAPQARGTAVSLFASCFFIGQSAGVWAASALVDRYGYASIFTVAALMLPLIGGGFAWRMARRSRDTW